jgi:hypothetical protein
MLPRQIQALTPTQRQALGAQLIGDKLTRFLGKLDADQRKALGYQ